MDAIDCDKISGWAFTNAGGYAYLDIYVIDQTGLISKAATIKANNASRPDVRAAYDNNPNIPLDCGFVWAIPNAYKSGHPLSIKVVSVNDISPIGNSPKTSSGDCNNPDIVPPGGTTGPWKPSLPPDVLRTARFYIDMTKISINFSDEERAVIAEYNLYEGIQAYVDQYGSKPNLTYLSLNLNNASDEQIKNAITNLMDPGIPKNITDGELQLLAIGSPTFHVNLSKY